MKSKTICLLKAVGIGIFLLVFPILSGTLVTILALDKVQAMFVQAAFMFIPIVIAAVVVVVKKIDCHDLRLTINKNPKEYLCLIPTVLVFVPMLIRGCEWKGTAHFFGVLVLYAIVGISEELYYRSIICLVLEKVYARGAVIVISTVIFGLGHAATALTGMGLVMTILTIVNALIFGFMAVNLMYAHGSIFALMLIHFLFDFINKFVVVSGTELIIAECVRGGVMLIYGLVIYFVFNRKHPTTNA